ncbi:LysE family translocator [Horticoccus sp. 23ND18S-11]|uniref:LysE family translocator n=1 Tax=Horticoccus sp. 23ND18S-11 TaxID=3391832 RepID=UPI0039C9A608
MSAFESYAISALTGIVSGLLLSIPVGPINLTIMNEGARRGYMWAALIGLGATVMEVIYCTVAFTGFASFFGNPILKAAMELFSFAFMLILGIKFLLAKNVVAPLDLGEAVDRMEHQIERKLHPHSAFWTGFVRTMANPGVLLFWIVLAASFLSRGWVDDTWASKLVCIGGVTVGVGSWFFGLAWLVSRGQGKFSERTLLRMERGSGIGLLVLALAHGIVMISHLARHAS